MRARQAIERCDVAILVIDASEKLAAQDLHVADMWRMTLRA
jgi:predicted GTPase